MREIEKYKIIGIIQARMGSKRLPKKMSYYLGDYPIIDWVIQRSKKSELIQKCVLATSTKAENDYLIERANKYSIDNFRGSEDNVLSRFVEIVNKENADVIVRICADNPFIDPDEIDRLLENFLIDKPDYAFNHIPAMGNNYVDGFGAEIFSSKVLNIISKKATTLSHFEHVTKYIWDNQNEFEIISINAPKELSFPGYKFDIDTKDDLNMMIRLVENGISITTDAKKIIEISNSLNIFHSFSF